MYSAEQFYDWGLITELVDDDDDLLAAGLKWGKTMSSHGPQALSWIKQATNVGFDMPIAEGLDLKWQVVCSVLYN